MDIPFAQLLQRAETSDPPIRAAALMRIARLQSTSDPDAARRTFLRGLDEARQLSPYDRDCLLPQARLLAAAVAPDLISEIRARGRPHGSSESDAICRIMLEHHHL